MHCFNTFKQSNKPVIIWDGGGVILEFSPDALAKSYGGGRYQQQILALFKSEYWKSFDRGDLTLEELQNLSCKILKFSIDDFKSIFNHFLESLKPKWETIKLVEMLNKLGFEQYYLSNGSMEYIHYVRSDYYKQKHHFAIDTLFRDMIISAELRIAKPELAIYLKAVEKFKIKNRRVIFVDDSLPNILAVDAIPGWSGILFENNVKDLMQELVRQGVRGIEIEKHPQMMLRAKL